MLNKKEFIVILDAYRNERSRVKLTLDNGKLIDFVFQYESLINEKWKEIVRYDMAHGFFHRDFITQKGEKEKTRIEISDIKTAATYAEQDIRDRWEFYKDKFLKNYKNRKT